MAEPFIQVPSPPPRQPRYGLVASVGGEAAVAAFTKANAGDNGPNRWESGFQFRPFDCASAADPFDPSCSIAATSLFPATSMPDFTTYRPFAISATISCSTFGADLEQYKERAKQKLLTSTSHKVEAELWSGTFAAANSYDNPYFTKAAAATDLGSASLMSGFALLQHELGDCAQGSRGMIHLPTYAASLLYQMQAIRKENGILLDAFDNVIVAGSGYPYAGTGNVLAFATTMVDVRLSELIQTDFIQGPHDASSPYGDNTVLAIAWRVAAATWDQCCLAKVSLDPTTVCG